MPPAKQPLSFPLFSKLAIVFAVLVALVVLGVIGGSRGEVEIQVKPTVTTRTIETFVPVAATSTEGVLGAVFENKTFERREPVQSSEGKVIEQKARYAITIHNQYSRDQVLVATTRFLRDSVLYRLVDGVTVKAGTSIPAVVEADKVGTGYELKLGDKLIIPGLWEGVRSHIFGIADRELKAGVATVRVLTEESIDEAEQRALVGLRDDVTTFKNEHPDMLVFGSGEEVQILRPEAGETDEPQVVAEQAFQVVEIPKQILREHLQRTLSAMERGKHVLLSMDEMTVEVLDWKNNSARLHITLPVGSYSPIARDGIRLGEFRGKNEERIRRMLQEQYGIVEVAVNYSPAFLKPLLPRIGKVKLTIIEP